MSLKFTATSAQNQFLQLLQNGGELRELFLLFVAKLDVLTDYKLGMISFDPDGSLICLVEDLPFLVVFKEAQQAISLQRFDEDNEIFLDVNQWDFDEDAVEEMIDYINDQILTGETHDV